MKLKIYYIDFLIILLFELFMNACTFFQMLYCYRETYILFHSYDNIPASIDRNKRDAILFLAIRGILSEFGLQSSHPPISTVLYSEERNFQLFFVLNSKDANR